MADTLTKTRFNRAPTINKSRTKFDLSHNYLTTANTGDFFPVLAERVNPGETFSLKTSSLVRLETSLHQTMDNAFFEIAYFFVPMDQVFDKWNEMNGANDDPWTQTTVYNLPQIDLTNNGGAATVNPGSLLNQLMLPSGSYGSGANNQFFSVDATPMRSVFEIYNQYYRDENFDSIIYYSKGATDIMLGSSFTLNGSPFYPALQTLRVNRLPDVYSKALPAPQRGSAVSVGLSGILPVQAIAPMHDSKFTFADSAGVTLPDYDLGLDSNSKLGRSSIAGSPNQYSTQSLYSDMGVNASGISITVNDLRIAIARQAILERDARTGTRPKERNFGVWGVETPDLELDRPEFLGGKRIPISMMEVLQTSETGTTVLGTDAGHSKTVDYSDGFVKSFTKSGWIIGVAYLRTSRSYSQGIDRRFSKKSIWDLYDPMLDNIGEVGILKKELYSLDSSSTPQTAIGEQVFGYQEAWYDYKERQNRFSGYFQSGISGTLDSWHYGDLYNGYQSLSAAWLKETYAQVDRTIAVSSNQTHQWSINLHFELYATRPMGKYSIPNTFGF